MPTLKNIQAEIDRIKSRSRTWLIIAAVAVVLIVVLLITVLRGKGKPDESYLLQVQQMDSTIKYQQRSIDVLKRFVLAQDSALLRLDRQYKQNRVVETKIIHQYEQIPVDVNRLDREQLRREVADY